MAPSTKIRVPLIALGVVAAVAAVRWALEPKSHPPPGITEAPARVADKRAIERGLLSLQQLAAAVANKRIVLVGEEHFFNKTTDYLTRLVEQLPWRNVHLMLELPAKTQGAIDRYLSGDDAAFASIWSTSGALPYQRILRWARRDKQRVRRVTAIDEDQLRIAFNRLLLHDTRNETMARRVLAAYRSDPAARIVVYGGQLHMMLAGRYRYDVADRQPAGSRIIRAGVPRADVASIMLSGGDLFHLHQVWNKPGALRISGRFAALPFPYFIDYPIFGADKAGELFDYFVNLGQLGPRAGRR